MNKRHFTVMDVIACKVPLDPVMRYVTSYPGEDLIVLEPQLAMVLLGMVVCEGMDIGTHAIRILRRLHLRHLMRCMSFCLLVCYEK